MANDFDVDISHKLHEFAEDTITQLKLNMKTQRVWPREVYPRYAEINKIRKKNKQWHSTGDSLETLKFMIRNTRLDTARIDFFFNEYLRYVDIGVGSGRKAEDVDRSRKAKYKNRYTKWYTQGKRTHRPAFMMEFRHLQHRMGLYALEKYQYEATAYIMRGPTEYFEEIK